MLSKFKKWDNDLKRDLYAIYLAYTKHKLPWHAKILAIVVLAYALSPIDLIPDFIPVLGYLDDLIILPLGIALLIKVIPEDIIKECKKEAENAIKEKLPKNYVAAVLIIAFWIGIVVLIAYKIIKK